MQCIILINYTYNIHVQRIRIATVNHPIVLFNFMPSFIFIQNYKYKFKDLNKLNDL